MEQHEQLEQLRKDRVSLHLTIRECAELTNTSESTAKRVFSSNSVQNFTISTLQPYIDLFAELRANQTEGDIFPDGTDQYTSAHLIKMYRAKCRDYTLLRLDAEKRDRRHSIINMIQTIIIFVLILFIVAWLVYDVVNLDRGWVRSVFSFSDSAINSFRA